MVWLLDISRCLNVDKFANVWRTRLELNIFLKECKKLFDLL